MPVYMEWLPGERGTCFRWRISACKYLQRSCLAYFSWRISTCKRLKPCRGYAAGMPYLTCESDCVGCGSKSTNELITCDGTRHASSLLCICILLDVMETGVIFYEMDLPYIYEDIVQYRFYVIGAEIRAHQADPETELMEEHILESVPEEDIPIEQISVSSSKPSSEESLTASINGLASAGQTSSMSASAPPEIMEISNEEDKDSEECSDVIVISSDDDS
ncbi:hypothetical protein AHAS_Ahas09G0123600 [Arachis hypogaea]